MGSSRMVHKKSNFKKISICFTAYCIHQLIFKSFLRKNKDCWHKYSNCIQKIYYNQGVAMYSALLSAPIYFPTLVASIFGGLFCIVLEPDSLTLSSTCHVTFSGGNLHFSIIANSVIK